MITSDKFMTSTTDVKPHHCVAEPNCELRDRQFSFSEFEELRRLAQDATSTRAFKDTVAKLMLTGASHADVINSIAGTPWRYIILNCGTSLSLQHRDSLITEFGDLTDAFMNWKDDAHNDEWHENILLDIRDLEHEHTRLTWYLLQGDEQPSLDDAINTIFHGSGYLYDGSAIVESDEDWDDN